MCPSVVVTYSGAMNPIVYNYCVGSLPLARRDSIRDLGVILWEDMSFLKQIEDICCKATRSLGFIMRASRCGLSLEVIRMLYIYLVRSKLEYCSVIWSLHQQSYIDRLESIQVRFLRLIGCRMGHRYCDVPIHDLRTALGLNTLVERREVSDAILLYKILKGEINCPALLALIDLRVPQRKSTRSSVLFGRQHCSINYDAQTASTGESDHSIHGLLQLWSSSVQTYCLVSNLWSVNWYLLFDVKSYFGCTILLQVIDQLPVV